jgi:hypothetical protein
MKLAGVLVTLLGFVVSILSLLLSSTAGRLSVVLLGVALSLFGIIGVLNRAYLKNPVWKKG